ncbi:hypothetical protein [Bradyrhizobium sp. 6(2017)]|uniref:hypothetical protein n=1 Tax=Bradyrhizobium sp. 6(2017) TaxID=1197460 RepID=UPI0013E14225|nr:hypothetical protein [Bradyrhizobium sp. 6(2017)]QIG97523.1 hypothetical protein G6P99_37540 [Bradyrhizobium sp. 6(2017)]
MNRRDRRAARKRGDMILIDYGHLLERDQNYGLSVACYVCATAHKASGIARIEDKRSSTIVPLCEACPTSDDRGNDVARKYLNAPDLEISEGGEATTEQVLAMAERQHGTAH